MKGQIAHCPECESRNITLRLRKVFLKRTVICVIIFCFGYSLFDSIRQEKFVDGVVIVGLFSGIIMMAAATVMGIIWTVWAIITKKTSYKCKYCKNIFENPDYWPARRFES
jgi:DNA-directed RNA polymerase subunit RPC12/RpoP